MAADEFSKKRSEQDYKLLLERQAIAKMLREEKEQEEALRKKRSMEEMEAEAQKEVQEKIMREIEERQARQAQEEQGNVCKICQESLFGEDGAQVIVLGCGDIFHVECVQPWLSTCIEN